MIIAGDIGGTKCNLALFDYDGKQLISVVDQTYRSRHFSGLEEVASRFLEKDSVKAYLERISAFSFGVAGPVVQGKVKTPNLPWSISLNSLEERLGTGSIALLNDLEATGYGVLILKESEIQRLNRGISDPRGNIALIAAGTGLGEALIVQLDKEPVPIPSEGGHTDFAPRTHHEISLLEYLLGKYNRVSYERVLSGPGIQNIYEFLKNTRNMTESPWFKKEVENTGDPSAVISKAAIEGRCPLCIQTLEIFVSIYGAEAGNLALTLKATGGVFICGGIAPKILPKLVDGSFITAFKDKGRLEKLLSGIPVSVVLNPKTALWGAADYARVHFENRD